MPPPIAAPEGLVASANSAGFIFGSVGIASPPYVTSLSLYFRSLEQSAPQTLGRFSFKYGEYDPRTHIRTGTFTARTFCLALPPGRYQMQSAFGYLVYDLRGSTRHYGADFAGIEFTVEHGRATYVGDWLLDQRRKTSNTLAGAPIEPILEVSDKLARDLPLLKNQYLTISNVQVAPLAPPVGRFTLRLL